MAADKEHFDNREEKTGSSTEETGIFGDERTVRRDKYGDRTEISREETGLLGEQFTQHYDAREREIGRTKSEKGIFGDEYEQRYNNRGDKIGKVRREKGVFGDEFDQEYDERGNKTGRTRVSPAAREREEREARDRESLQEMHKAFASSGKITFKDLKKVAWGPTLKLAFWRGVATGIGGGILILIMTPGPLLARLAFAALVAVGWGLTGWYGAPLCYFLFRGLGWIFGPITGGIFYLISNIMLLMLGFFLSLGDPIIYYVHRKYPNFFGLDGYSAFSMKTMIFVLKGEDSEFEHLPRMRQDERRYEPPVDTQNQHRQEPAWEAPKPAKAVIASPPESVEAMSVSAQAPPPQLAEPYARLPLIDAPEEEKRRLPIAAIVTVVIILAGGGAFYVWNSGLLNPPAVQQAVADPNSFAVQPYTSTAVIVAAKDGLHYRVIPFARPDVGVLGDTIAGEVLNITGVVNQADGGWYQVRLADGRTGYFKATLAQDKASYDAPVESASSASAAAPTSSMPSAAAFPLAGHWQGSYTRDDGKHKTTSVELTIDGAGERFNGWGSEPRLLTPLYMNVSGKLQQDRAVTIVMSVSGYMMNYTGTLSPDGESISGQWTRGDKHGTFQLQRTTTVVQSIRPPCHTVYGSNEIACLGADGEWEGQAQ